ncbi:FAD/NAD(P)-binding domain-containing protein [Aspergillus eucalypticola CBS 122712]|uniref:FAD/NAD(P)-binding domain-containing protein n=1 Tax=Aspergillus eucalypticola (strain CBS 122712 / IBT 29274) TaxID=1448314 RepID=A0A317VMX7_ASPEC|nr:FAD/NAD(P)-binding domain-containing protein [Aspergillus eucalypticola CBS 122712]PWY75684.1 FAD/NAD(P)-binding domain-containing protein [Aspergillus eucalypticola CBS 122712]
MTFARIAATLTAFAVVGNARTCMETEVVILGAGVAGVTAAETLHNNAVENFIVLEYQDRIGGRMHEVTFGKGQQYVHGNGGPETHVNPIWDLAIKANLRTLTSEVENATFLFNALEAVSDADSKVLADAGIRLHHHLEDRTYRAALRRTRNRRISGRNFRVLYRSNDQCDGQVLLSPRGVQLRSANVVGPLLEGQNAWRLRKNTIVKEIEHDDDSVTAYSTDGNCVRANCEVYTRTAKVEQRCHCELRNDHVYQDIHAISAFLLAQEPPLDVPGVLEGSNILVVTVVNDQAHRVERQSEAKTQSEIMESNGSYSNWPPAVSANTHRNLRANVGRVLFAGEATSPKFSGFLHGAYYEGKRAAESFTSREEAEWGDYNPSKEPLGSSLPLKLL